MNRRELLALIGSAAALAPFGAMAQPGLPVIGYLSSRSAEAETPLRTPFLEGLEQQGFVVGRNIAIEYRYAEGNFDRLPSLAAELVGLPATLLVATATPAALAEEGNRNHPDHVRHRLRSSGAGPRRQLQPSGRQRDGSVHLRDRGNFEAPGTAA
jgi:hypothetical protein